MDLRIKSKCLWLKAGYQYSSFFHYPFKERNRRNTIKELTLDNGGKINDPELIKREVKAYFQEIYTNEETILVDDMLSLSREIPQLLQENHDFLIHSITFEEVQRVMWSLHPN